MGHAALVGLGLALAQPTKRVLVVTGDGDMLMGLGALATVADQAPRNLAIVVVDNEAFGETGGQRTSTSGAVDLAGMAAAAGFPTTLTARHMKRPGRGQGTGAGRERGVGRASGRGEGGQEGW